MSSQDRAPSVAVIGAAGQTGKRVVHALTQRGAAVRALVHRDDQAERVPEAAEARAVDLQDVPQLTRAFAGMDAAYYVPPAFDSREEQYGANVIGAAESAGLPRLVYHSVMHSATPSMVHHLRKSRVELALRESPLAWTVLEPCIYSQSILRFLSEDRAELRVGFDPEKRFTPLDLEDLAEAAACVLLESGHEYANYELAGSERLSAQEMAQAISAALGREVRVTALTPSAVASSAAARLGEERGLEMKAMLEHYDSYGYCGNGNVLRMLLGREPVQFLDTVKRETRGEG